MTRVRGRPSVLVIHPEPNALRPLLGLLREAGVACAEARGREEAQAILGALRFDYVLVDLEGSAAEVARRLRQDHPTIEAIVVGEDVDDLSCVPRPLAAEPLLRLVTAPLSRTG